MRPFRTEWMGAFELTILQFTCKSANKNQAKKMCVLSTFQRIPASEVAHGVSVFEIKNAFKKLVTLRGHLEPSGWEHLN